MAVDREQYTITDVVMIFILDQGMILNSSQSGLSVQKGSTMEWQQVLSNDREQW